MIIWGAKPKLNLIKSLMTSIKNCSEWEELFMECRARIKWFRIVCQCNNKWCNQECKWCKTVCQCLKTSKWWLAVHQCNLAWEKVQLMPDHNKEIYSQANAMMKMRMIWNAYRSAIKKRRKLLTLWLFRKLKILPSIWKLIIITTPIVALSKIGSLRISFMNHISSICLNPKKKGRFKNNF